MTSEDILQAMVEIPRLSGELKRFFEGKTSRRCTRCKSKVKPVDHGRQVISDLEVWQTVFKCSCDSIKSNLSQEALEVSRWNCEYRLAYDAAVFIESLEFRPYWEVVND